MRNAGLLDGDTVVVIRGAPTETGDIVVAMLDGGFTLKYLARDGSNYSLKPDNKLLNYIRLSDALEPIKRMTGCVRKY